VRDIYVDIDILPRPTPKGLFMKQHKISLTTAILMNINIMVGSGILIGPGVMTAVAGNASFITWLLVALLFLPVVLSTVQMSRYSPGSGGFYRYAKAGLNGTAGFWSGLMYVAGYTFAIGVEILALRKTMESALGADWAWFTQNPLLFNVVTILAIVAVNMLSLKFFSRLLNSLTISKIIPIVSVILLLPFVINPSFTVTASEVRMIPYSMPMAIFGYLGFEYCTSISHHIENSERNAPLAILIGFTVTALLYMLFHFGTLNLMGPTDLASHGAASFAQYLTLPIPYFKALMNIIIPAASIITLFAAAAGLLNANSVMLHSMAEQRLLHFSHILVQETSWYRPYVTIMLLATVAFSIATFIPTIPVVGTLSNMGVIASFILPLISLSVLQRQRGKASQIPLTYLALALVLAGTGYCIFLLGTTMGERLYLMVPYLVFLAVGWLLYRGKAAAHSA